jgi:pimeloyl-ACP methyl ester carboxylesterase
MFNILKKLKFGARVFLSRKGGETEMIDVRGRPTAIMHGGEGEPFVYLHSSLGETFLWFPFFQSFAKQFTTYVPTHPGFGKSGGFDEIDGIEDMAFHYLELLDSLGLEQVILGGVSLGGWIAAEFAARWPERVKKLWISAAPGMWVDNAPLADLFRYMDGRPANREKVRSLLFHDSTGFMAKTIVVDEPDEQRMLSAYQSMTALARLVWERPYSPKLPARLYRVQCPVLLLWGDDDRLVPPAHAEAYKQYLPQAELKLIKDCGHLLMFEKENDFVAEVTRFCRDG